MGSGGNIGSGGDVGSGGDMGSGGGMGSGTHSCKLTFIIISTDTREFSPKVTLILLNDEHN